MRDYPGTYLKAMGLQDTPDKNEAILKSVVIYISHVFMRSLQICEIFSVWCIRSGIRQMPKEGYPRMGAACFIYPGLLSSGQFAPPLSRLRCFTPSLEIRCGGYITYFLESSGRKIEYVLSEPQLTQ